MVGTDFGLDRLTTITMPNLNEIEKLLSMLRCPACKAGDSLKIKDGKVEFNISVPLYPKTICCDRCNEHYPITDDLIPIMWSETLRQAFSDINKTQKANNPVVDASRNLFANVKI